MDCRLPGSSVHGILQPRILGWVAVPFSRDLLDSRIKSGLHFRQSFLLFEPPGKPLWRYRLLQNTEYSFPCYTPVLWWSVLFKDANPIMGVHLLDFTTSQTSHILIPSCLGGIAFQHMYFRGTHKRLAHPSHLLSGIVFFFPLWLAYSWYLPFFSFYSIF